MSCETLTGNVLRQNPSYMNGGQIPPPSAEELATVHRETREIPTEELRPRLYTASLGPSGEKFLDAAASACSREIALQVLIANQFNEFSAMKEICSHCCRTMSQFAEASELWRSPLEVEEEEFVYLWNDAVNFQGNWARTASGVVWSNGVYAAFFSARSNELVFLATSEQLTDGPAVWFFRQVLRTRRSIWDPWLEHVLYEMPSFQALADLGDSHVWDDDADGWLQRLNILDEDVSATISKFEGGAAKGRNKPCVVDVPELEHLSKVIKCCQSGVNAFAFGLLRPADGKTHFGSLTLRAKCELPKKVSFHVGYGIPAHEVFPALRPAVFGQRGMDGAFLDPRVRAALLASYPPKWRQGHAVHGAYPAEIDPTVFRNQG